MSKATYEKLDKRSRNGHEWLWEILIIISVVPAVVYGVASLGQLPIV